MCKLDDYTFPQTQVTPLATASTRDFHPMMGLPSPDHHHHGQLIRTADHGNISPPPSPPTPPSPLPVSVGPGNQRYLFTPSPSISPPFSSADSLPLLSHVQPAAFFLDMKPPEQSKDQDDHSSCLADLLGWVLNKCCSCCTRPLFNDKPWGKRLEQTNRRLIGLD